MEIDTRRYDDEQRFSHYLSILFVVFVVLAVVSGQFRTSSALADSGGYVATAAADDEVPSVYLIIGQSNAAGRGPLPATLQTYDGVSVFDGSDFVPATPNINQYSTVQRSVNGYSLGYTFGGAMQSVTGTESLLVSNARGGTSIQFWLPDGNVDPTTGENYFAQAVSAVRDAIDSSDTALQLGGVVWHQGEADSTDVDYTVDIQYLVNGLRREFADPDLPFVAGELAYSRNDSAMFNERLNGIAPLIENFEVASAEGLVTTDGTHFDSPSLRELGDRYAIAMLGLQGYDTSGLPDWTHPEHVDNGGASGEQFVPEEGARYTFTTSQNRFLAGDGEPKSPGGDEVYSATADVSLSDSAWHIEPHPAGNGYFQIKLAAGGDEQLLYIEERDGVYDLELTSDDSVGVNTYFDINEKEPGLGRYLITAVDFEVPEKSRIFVTNAGQRAGVASSVTTDGAWATFTITEVEASAA